jgi:ubiquinone/menaquinone biosynthesis C-methylase UbiE
MKATDDNKDFWIEYWNKDAMINTENLQQQVGRTKNKIALDANLWNDTLKEIIESLQLSDSDEVLDLCAGNGLISTPLSKICRHVTAVDFSAKLLSEIDTKEYKNITTIESDLRLLQFEEESVSKAIIYFAMQYFTEGEAVVLLKSIHRWLKPGGLLYIGDVPDADKIFDYFNTAERQNNYFESLVNNKPILGVWFKKLFFEKAALYAGFKGCVIIEQPDYQLNSHYRYDVLLKK